MRIDPADYDYDWFALDASGAIGHFASAGSSVVPESVLESQERYDELFQYFRALTPNGKGSIVYQKSGAVLTDFVEMAAKGLYSYDYSSLGKRTFECYKLIARPSVPLLVSSITDPRIADALRRTTFEKVSFLRSSKISKQQILRAGYKE